MSTTTPPPHDGDTWVANPGPVSEAAPEPLAGAPAETRRRPPELNTNRRKKRDVDDDDDHRVTDRKKKRDVDDDDHLRPDDDHLRPDHLRPNDDHLTKSKSKRARDDDDDHRGDGDPPGAVGGGTVTPSPRRDTSGAAVRDDEAPVTPPRADGGPTVRDHRSEVRSAPVNPEPEPIVRDRGDPAPTLDGTVREQRMQDFDDVVGDDLPDMSATSVAGGVGEPGDMTPVGDVQMDSDDWDTQSVTTASDAEGLDDADAYTFGGDAADADESTTVTPDDGDPAIGDTEMSEQLD